VKDYRIPEFVPNKELASLQLEDLLNWIKDVFFREGLKPKDYSRHIEVFMPFVNQYQRKKEKKEKSWLI